MNSTLQCLHSVPELKSALLRFNLKFLCINFEAAFDLVFDIILLYFSYSDTVRSNGIDQASHNLTVATRNTFGDLDQSVRPVAPLQFLQVSSPLLPRLVKFFLLILE